MYCPIEAVYMLSATSVRTFLNDKFTYQNYR